jgi:hypothetical protein
VVGVLSVLLALLGIVSVVDARYVSRVEYVATMSAVSGQLAEINTELRANRQMQMERLSAEKHP